MNFDEIVNRATKKRDRIITCEGDANGERLQPWYLEQLIQEEIRLEIITSAVVL